MKTTDNQEIGFTYSADESKITELAGITLSEYYHDLSVMITAQKRANQIIAQELGIQRQGFVLSRGHVNGTELLGCKLFWPEDDEPMVARPALEDPEEIESFQPPDPPDNPVVQRELKKAREFYELTGQKTSVGFEGPVSVAALCLGVESFYLLAATDPRLCELLVHKVTEACIDWKCYHDSEMGIGEYGEAEAADDSAAFLSPSLFARLSLPYIQRWYDAAFPGHIERHLHICGPTDHVLNQIAKLKLASFDMGEMVDIPKAKELLPNTYLWRIVDFRLIRDGDPSEIEAYISNQLNLGAPRDRFGIHMEGWRGVPLWKAKLVKDIVERYNQRHTPDNRCNDSS